MVIRIFPYGDEDDDLALRTNAAVTIVALAAKEQTAPALQEQLRRPYEQLMRVWDLIPLLLKEAFSQSYRGWLHEQDRQVHPNPRIEQAAVTTCIYAIAIISLVGPIGDMQLLKLVREQAAVEEELHRRAGR